MGRGPPPYRTTTAAAEAADPSTTAVPHIEGSVTGSGSAPRLAPEQGGAAGRPGPPWSLRATIPPSPPSSRAWRCAGVHLMHLVGTNRAGHLHHDPPLHLASPISRDAAGSTLERKLPPTFRTVSSVKSGRFVRSDLQPLYRSRPPVRGTAHSVPSFHSPPGLG